MSTPEQLLWQYIRPCLRAGGHAVRVENPLDPGIPDVSYACPARLGAAGVAAEGWLELKVAPGVVRHNGIIRTRVATAQRAWWRERAARGGRVRVLLRILPLVQHKRTDYTHLIFDGPAAAAILGNENEDTLRRAAIDYWLPGHNMVADATRLWRALTVSI